MTPRSRALSSVVPSSSSLTSVDLALAVWVLVWIGMGVAIGIKLSDLAGLSHTEIVTGRAVETVGKSLGFLGAVPLLGGSLAGLAHAVQAAGASAVSHGQSTLSSISTLSVLLAIAVALLPSAPVFGLYLPVRLHLRREALALRQAVVDHGNDPAFRAFLARRAIDSVAYDRLNTIATPPWARTGAEGETRDLAAAELARLGIEPELLDRPGRD